MVIPAVVKDPGGTNGVLPVARILRENLGQDVRLVASGTASRILAETDENYEILRSAQEAFRRYPNPKAMLTSMCSNGGVGKELIPFYKGLCPTVSFHDYWGTCLLRDEWDDPKHHPDFFVVNDELDAKIVLGAWSDYKQEQLVITGYPMCDQYAVKYDEAELLTEISAKLGMDISSKPVVLFPCGVYSGVSRFISEVVDVFNGLNLDIYFVPRLHPRLGFSFLEEVEPSRQALGKFRGGTMVVDSSTCAMPDLIRIATVVISDFSTVLLQAILARKSNISVWYMDAVQEAYRKEFGPVQHLMPEPPFLTLECSARATNRDSFCQQVVDALDGRFDLTATQEKYFPLDGQNALRAAKFVSSLL